MNKEFKEDREIMDKYVNKIINADCMDILKQLPDKCIDLVVTDPPYGGGGKQWENKTRSRFGGRFDKYHFENRGDLGEQIPNRGYL